MGRFIQDSDCHGSQKDLQILINSKKDLLDKEISYITNTKIDITWKSPLEMD